MQKRATAFELVNLNIYWVGLSFMWNSLHVLILPAILLGFVADARKNTVLGLLTFTGLIVAMVVQPLSGSLSDQWGSRYGRRRPWIALGTGLDLLFLAVLAFAGSLPLLALGYIGLQFTSNLAHGPAQGLMHDRVPREQMGMASGIKNLFDMAGLVVSSLLIGRILTAQNVPFAFGIVAAFLVISSLFTLFGVRERRYADGPATEGPRPFDFAFGALKDNPAYRRLIYARLLFLTGVYGVQTFAQYYIRDTLAVPDPVKLTGDLLATIVLALIGFSLAAGYLADRFGRKPLHIAAVALVTAGNLLMMLASDATAILVFGSIIGAGIGLFVSANWALANDHAPPGEGGKFLGLTNLATAGAGALSRLAGPGIDSLNALRPGAYLGYDGLFILAAAAALLSLWVLKSVPELHKQTPTQNGG